MTENYQDFFRKVNQAQWDDLLYQYLLLDEWMKKTFPEATARFEFNADNTKKRITVIVSVLSGEEMSPEDRLFKQFTLVLTEATWYNTVEMDKIIKSIYPATVQMITRIINDHYKKSKQKRGIE